MEQLKIKNRLNAILHLNTYKLFVQSLVSRREIICEFKINPYYCKQSRSGVYSRSTGLHKLTGHNLGLLKNEQKFLTHCNLSVYVCLHCTAKLYQIATSCLWHAHQMAVFHTTTLLASIVYSLSFTKKFNKKCSLNGFQSLRLDVQLTQQIKQH